MDTLSAVPAAGSGEAAARIDVLLASFATDPALAERAEDLVRAVVDFYDDGLGRLIDGIGEAGGGGLLAQAAADPAVASMLALHDLHPVPVAERVAAALDDVRPYLGSHAGDVDLLGVDADETAGGLVVRLRLVGSCDGCAASALTVRDTIERSIVARAPEVVAVEVEGVAPDPSRDGDGASGGRTLLPVIGPAS